MTGKTTIEWTHMPGFQGDVWNPTTGCTRVSDGCDNCYAFALHDKRYASNLKAAKAFIGDHPDAAALGDKAGQSLIATTRFVSRGRELPWPKQYDLPFSRVQLLEERLDVPLRTRKPTCYFVDSMADLFHEDVPDEFLDRVFLTMAKADRHRFLVLTKRPDRMRTYMEHFYDDVCYEESGCPVGEDHMRHIWLGTSVEDQPAADERIPHLLATPAAVRFLSCEPLLGPVDLRDSVTHDWRPAEMGEVVPRIDWVIAGGESGARARPMDLAWARSLRDECAAAGVSFFMKQLGAEAYEVEHLGEGDHSTHEHETYGVLMRESHGRDVDEWPEDLRIRTWPR